MADLAQLLRSLGKTSKTKGLNEYELNHMLAYERAMRPVSEGGLGLGANNTAIDRARAMGFDVESPVYHGTNADIHEMNVEGKEKTFGSGAFVTSNSVVPETYANASTRGDEVGANILPLLLRKEGMMEVNAKGKNWNDINTNDLVHKRKRLTDLFPEDLSPNDATTTDEVGALVGMGGYPGVTIKNVKDLGPNSHVFRAKEYLEDKYGIVPDETWSNVTGKQFKESQDYMKKLYDKQKSDVTAIHDSSRIRSRFAAFDPFRKSESDLLASHPLASTGAALAATGGLSGMLKSKLNEPFDPFDQYFSVGFESPISKGQAIETGLNALPGYGDVLGAISLADWLSNKFKKGNK